MKKIIILLLVFVFVTMSCLACGNTEETEKSLDKIKYSNLVSDSIQNDLEQVMSDSGISPKRQQVFFDHVNYFNEIISPKMLVSEFEIMPLLESKYDPYEMQDQWMQKSPDFMGYNCRITAFSLFADYIELPATSETNDEMIMMDMVALDEDDSILLEENDKNRFSVLYSTVPTTMTKDIDCHVRNLQENWQERGIRFLENDKASLIMVIFHESFTEDENYLFVGHAGVLFENEGKLYFVEKLAFQEPYQLTEFENRTGLNDYLMTKYDVAFDQPTAAPFIMENSQLMEGYRRVNVEDVTIESEAHN